MAKQPQRHPLWFGDERGYNATTTSRAASQSCCGLVMKEDITQSERKKRLLDCGCGLVMKEDITQQT